MSIDACATDNGGCGDPAAYRCESVPAGPPHCAFDPASDYAAITKDVHVLVGDGAVPSSMVVYGDTAFPIALDDARHSFVAAARVAKGRIVAYAHETFLVNFKNIDDRGLLLDNALCWASQKEAPVVGIEAGLQALAARLTSAGVTSKWVNGVDFTGIDVYVTTTYADRTDTEVQAIRDFVAKGGGLVTGGLAWWNADKYQPVALAYPGNKILRDAGIVVLDDYAGSGTTPITLEAPGPLDHALRALDKLAAHVTGKAPLSLEDQQEGVTTASYAVDKLPVSLTSFFDKATAILSTSPPPVPTEQAPFKPADMPIAAFEMHLQSKLASELPAATVKAHPAAADFPGLPPANAPKIVRTVTIDGTYEGLDGHYGFANPRADVWRATGLYAPPGAVIHVTIGAGVAGQGLGIEIGAHTDSLWHLDTWPRFPKIDRHDALDAVSTDVASAFGGPIYVTVPAGSSLGAVQVTLEGAIEAPHFVAGVTTPAQWLVSRKALGPWAELETAKFAITVPSTLVRTFDEPSLVFALWDQVLDVDADLAAIPHERPRAERLVVDRELSAGYLHSGYPIMAHLDMGPLVLDVPSIMQNGLWGPFHELGHNLQWSDWVLPGSIEASCNLWSVYASENVLGIQRAVAHPALGPLERQSRIDAYVAGGRDFSQWTVWTALETYLQLQEAFGWDPYNAVFAEYRTLSPVDVPTTDAERIDQWAVRFSKQVNKNLEPFFSAWGFPLSAAAKAQMAVLPAWAENPMK